MSGPPTQPACSPRARCLCTSSLYPNVTISSIFYASGQETGWEARTSGCCVDGAQHGGFYAKFQRASLSLRYHCHLLENYPIHNWKSVTLAGERASWSSSCSSQFAPLRAALMGLRVPVCHSLFAFCARCVGVLCKAMCGKVPLPNMKCENAVDNLIPRVSATLNLHHSRENTSDI